MSEVKHFKIFGRTVFVSDRQPSDKISIIGIDKGQPSGNWTAAVELEALPDGKWRLVRYLARPTPVDTK